jgi:hypothetical protein
LSGADREKERAEPVARANVGATPRRGSSVTFGRNKMSKPKRKIGPQRLKASASSSDRPDVQSVLSMSPEKRQEYFLLRVRETREIWILKSEAERPCIIEADPEYLPVFPSFELALAFSKLHPRFKPGNLDYNEFIEHWLPGLSRDQIDVGIIPNLEVTVLMMLPLALRSVLEDEW